MKYYYFPGKEVKTEKDRFFRLEHFLMLNDNGECVELRIYDDISRTWHTYREHIQADNKVYEGSIELTEKEYNRMLFEKML